MRSTHPRALHLDATWWAHSGAPHTPSAHTVAPRTPVTPHTPTAPHTPSAPHSLGATDSLGTTNCLGSHSNNTSPLRCVLYSKTPTRDRPTYDLALRLAHCDTHLRPCSHPSALSLHKELEPRKNQKELLRTSIVKLHACDTHTCDTHTCGTHAWDTRACDTHLRLATPLTIRT